MAKTTKIFLLVDVFHTLGAGAERQILELCKHLDREKYEISVGCLFKHNRLLKELERYNTQTVSFGVKRIYDIHGIKQGLRFKDFLRKKKIDILVTYHFGSDVWGTFFGRLSGISKIISNRRDLGFWRKKIHVWIYRLLDPWVHKIIVVSSAVKDIVVREEKVKESKLQVIHNGIDLKRFSCPVNIPMKKKELGLPSNTKILGCVGNFRPIKGHKFLVMAAQQIIKQFPSIMFLMIGGRELKQKRYNKKLEQMIINLGLKNYFRFLGTRKDVPELLACMDICILPSLSEGLSNTLLEYMAAGNPIVATKVGGNPEVITNQRNGILIEPADSEALAKAIIYLLENEEQRAVLGIQAKNDVKNSFSVEKMVQSYESLFHGLMKEK